MILRYFSILMGLISSITLLTGCNDELEFSYISKYSRAVSESTESGFAASYYYIGKEKVSIYLDTTKVYVIREHNSVTPAIQSIRMTDNNSYTGEIISRSDFDNSVGTHSDPSSPIIALEDVTYDGVPLSHFIYVKLKSKGDVSILESLADNIGWSIIENDTEVNIVTLQAISGNGIRSLEASYYIAENGDFIFVDPGFNGEYYSQYAPSDPYYGLQWNLKNSPGISIGHIWDITKGDPNLNLAIFDIGIYEDNQEFSSHLHTFRLGSKIPSYEEGCSHGSAIASISGRSS